MFSKTIELTGLGLIAWGLAWAIAVPAGLIFGGVAIVLIGSVTDDASVGKVLRDGTARVRYSWRRQLARENGIALPRYQSNSGLVPCGCGGQEDCPLCDGTGVVPDPTLRVNKRSPHPPLRVDPDAEDFWSSRARAFSRTNGNRDLERLG